MKRRLWQAMVAGGAIAISSWASASLVSFQTFSGNVGYSSDGFGSTTQSGTISASVPAGGTVLAAYLYTSMFGVSSSFAGGGTLNGTAVTYTPLGINPIPSLEAGRADVTSIVKPIIDVGPGGQYDFTVTETSTAQDGEALVVVYSLPSLPTSTFGIVDGFSATTGDSTSINFGAPLDTSSSGFFAEMFIGDGFSFDQNDCSTSEQVSTITVNGTVITNNAGCNDDSVDANAANGNLITVGGFNDPFSPLLPTTAQDHERYDLAALGVIPDGSSTIAVTTFNASNNDNIFLAGFYVSGLASVNTPPPSTSAPEPATLALLGLGLSALALARRRARRN